MAETGPKLPMFPQGSEESYCLGSRRGGKSQPFRPAFPARQ